jgi:hypothetical protein
MVVLSELWPLVEARRGRNGVFDVSEIREDDLLGSMAGKSIDVVSDLGPKPSCSIALGSRHCKGGKADTADTGPQETSQPREGC